MGDNNNNVSAKILVSSTQYVGNGGVGTVAYALVKHLRDKGYKTAGLFYNKSKAVNFDPGNLGGIYIMRYQGTMHEKYKNKSVKMLDENEANLEKNRIIEYLGTIPDLIICIGHQSPSFNKELFADCSSGSCAIPIIMCTSGIIYYKRAHEKIQSLRDFLEYVEDNPQIKKTSYGKQEIEDIECCDLIVPNSDIMIEVYNTIYPEFKHKIEQQYYDTSKIVECLEEHKKFIVKDKDIDILVVSSRLDREEKNCKFLIPMLEKYDKYSKCFIGGNPDSFQHVPNSIFTGMISHANVYDYMARAKVLVVPSLYESANNTIREALQCKCLILTSNNVGFFSMYPDISICKSFDLQEWEDRMVYLIENYDNIVVDYKVDFIGSLSIEEIIAKVLPFTLNEISDLPMNGKL